MIHRITGDHYCGLCGSLEHFHASETENRPLPPIKKYLHFHHSRSSSYLSELDTSEIEIISLNNIKKPGFVKRFLTMLLSNVAEQNDNGKHCSLNSSYEIYF